MIFGVDLMGPKSINIKTNRQLFLQFINMVELISATNCCCSPRCSLKRGVFVIGLLLTVVSCVSLLVLICELSGAFVFFRTITSAGVVYVLISNVPTLLCGVLCIMTTSKNNVKERNRHLWLLEGALTSFIVQFIVSLMSFSVMMIVAIVRVDVVVATMAQEYVTHNSLDDQSLTPQLARTIMIIDLVLGVCIGAVVQLYMLWIVWSYSKQVNNQSDNSYAQGLLEGESEATEVFPYGDQAERVY
eukprot:TRINITY_DN1416_c1_g3_i1.p3 TRINITY_DN1416_c1_g3~~TRINITY_DN1416_c1_g3_i1.p3  ORF type:complete len:245 (-),score=4.47 TRINITY_DN1416_c1_g3_i1:1264-1998(-)